MLIPSISFQRLIRLCGEVKAAPSENEEIQFLCVVCAKLRQDPYLVNFFLEVRQKLVMKSHISDHVCSFPITTLFNLAILGTGVSLLKVKFTQYMYNFSVFIEVMKMQQVYHMSVFVQMKPCRSCVIHLLQTCCMGLFDFMWCQDNFFIDKLINY